MSIPYEPVLEHRYLATDPVCGPCAYSTINHPCGDKTCRCQCNAPAVLQIPEIDLDQPFKFDELIIGDPPPPTTPPTYTTTTANALSEQVTAELVSDPHRESGAFLLGVIIGLPMGIVGMAGGLNPWVRGILIGLSVLTVLWVAGRMSREDR